MNAKYSKTVHVLFRSLKIWNHRILTYILRRDEAFKRSQGFEPNFYIDNSP
jgi:hypothetical protein